MKLLALTAALTLAAPIASTANTVGCGENAFTHAEVVGAKPGLRAKGPITSIPDSLCADVIEDRRGQLDSLHVSVGDSGAIRAGRSSTQAPSQIAPGRLPLGR